jgi:hypothetical protein
MAAGTALCALHLTRWLTKHHVDVDWLGCKAGEHLNKLRSHPWKERANVIVLGSVRSNGIPAHYQREALNNRRPQQGSERRRRTLPYRLEEDQVIKVAPDGQVDGEPRVDQLTEWPYQVWSVISRRRGLVEGTVTMLAANYGQIIERVGEVLTNQEWFARFLVKNRFLRDSYMGGQVRNFQVLVQMSFHHQGSLPGHYDIEDAWFDLDDEPKHSATPF